MEKFIKNIKSAAERFREICEKYKVENKVPFIRIVTHYDTDGITSGAILARALQRADCEFWLSTVSQLEKTVFEKISKEKFDILFLLDLSGDFELVKTIKSDVFILDHHETKNVIGVIPKNITFANPFLHGIKNDEISGAGLTYLFAKEINPQNKDLADLAVLGMIGDTLGNSISKINQSILNDSNVAVKKGLKIFSSTRPLHKALEFSSNIFIPGVTGDSNGAVQFLREIGIKFDNEKTLLDLSDEELSKLVTAIVLRKINHKNNSQDDKDSKSETLSTESILGNIYTLKFFNRTEDARELSALINACGKLGNSDVAFSFCLGSYDAKEEADRLYFDYKKHIVEGLNYVRTMNNKIEGKNYVVYNCKTAIKDSLIGVVLSILSNSFIYPAGVVFVGLAYREDGKIKVSTRISGSRDENKTEKTSKINLRDILLNTCSHLNADCEVGGHERAAGCLVPIFLEENFINALEQELSKIK